MVWNYTIEKVGFIGLLDIPQKPTIFYSIDKVYRGIGIAKDAVAKVMDYLEESNALIQLFSEVFEDNYASIAVLKFNGFAKTGRTENNKVIFVRKYNMNWKDLSDREKELDRKIEKIEASGIRLDKTSNCLFRVMRNIGATKNEESFVRSRIALRLRIEALLSDTNKQIEDIETVGERFKKDEEEWERKK